MILPRRTARLPLVAMLALALAMPPARAFASPVVPSEDGLRRVLAYFTCALTVFLVHDSVSLTRAGTTCTTIYLTESS